MKKTFIYNRYVVVRVFVARSGYENSLYRYA